MCPFTELMALDRCIPIIDIVAGVSFQYRLDFNFKSKDQILPGFDSLLNNAKPLVLKPGVPDDFICESRIIGTRLEGGNVVIEAIISRFVENVTRMREAFNEVKEKIADINEQNKVDGILYTISLGESPFLTLLTNESRFLSYDSYFCTNLIAMSERQFCRLVAVQNYEKSYGEIIVNGTVFRDHEFFYSFDETTGTTAYICEDLYTTRMARKESLSANSGVPFHKTTAILLFKYVGLSTAMISLHVARYYVR